MGLGPTLNIALSVNVQAYKPLNNVWNCVDYMYAVNRTMSSLAVLNTSHRLVESWNAMWGIFFI